MSVGTRLRQTRRDRGLSVEELAARTRIATRILRSIEEDDFASVPSGIFLRGYLRACGRELGLDPEALVEQYRSEYEVPALAEPVVAESAPASSTSRSSLRIEPRLVPAAAVPSGARAGAAPEPQPQLARSAAASVAAQRADTSRVVLRLPAAAYGSTWSMRPIAMVLGGVALLALIVWSAELLRTSSRREALPVTSRATAPSVPETVGTSGATTRIGDDSPDGSASSHAGATGATIRLQLKATRRVWVTAHADRKRVLYRLLDPDEQVSLSGTEQINVRVGDAGALLYSVNGSDPRPAGSSGEVRNVSFSRAQPVY